MKMVLTAVATCLLLSACASGPRYNDSKASAAIAAAESAMKNAAKTGFGWRDTGKILDEAKKAQKAEDYKKAIELAGRAERQSMNAIKQADKALK